MMVFVFHLTGFGDDNIWLWFRGVIQVNGFLRADESPAT